VRAQHEEKIALLASVFVETISNRTATSVAEIALQVISNMEPLHIQVLRAFCEAMSGNNYQYVFAGPAGSGGGGAKYANASWIFDRNLGLDSDEYDFACEDLARLRIESIVNHTNCAVWPEDSSNV
jgi:hypothetical protein